MRIDVFNSKIAAEKNIKDSGKWDTLSPEEQRLVEKMVRVYLHVIYFSELRSLAQILDGTRAGLALPEEQRNKLTTWKKELSQVCLEFSVCWRRSIFLRLRIDLGNRKTSTRRT